MQPQTGTVKWFNNAKGFGFIRSEGTGEDIFAHFSQITMEGFRSLKAGEKVSFTLATGEKGLYASGIVRAGSPAARQPRAIACNNPAMCNTGVTVV